MISFTLCVISSLFFGGDRGEDVTVPSLIGERADSVMFPEGFEIKKVFAFSDRAPEGVIVSQHPAAGETRRRRADGGFGVLSVTVSLGSEKIDMADVSGRDAQEVCAELCSMGVGVRLVKVYSEDVPRGRVISAAPFSDTGGLKRGDRVTLFVSRGSITDKES